MIFLGDLKHVKDGIFKVCHVHYSPFSSSGGLGRTKEELEEMGVLVNVIPKPTDLDGKYSILCYDKNIKEVVYLYEDIPVRPDDEIKRMQYDIAEQHDVNSMVMDMVDLLYIKSNHPRISLLSNVNNKSVVNYIVYRCRDIYRTKGSMSTQEYLDIMTSDNIDNKNMVISILSDTYNIILT